MVRNYKRKPNVNRVNYSQENIARALIDLQQGRDSIRTISARYQIPVATLHRRWRGTVKNPGQLGHPTALLQDEERALAANLAALGDYGLSFDMDDLRRFVQHYLNKKCRVVTCFKDNQPGVDWGYGFLKRHKDILSNRYCQNISRRRAAVSDKIVGEYFEHLEKTLEGVPPDNIINYDETNLTDDPKTKLMLFRKGAKHTERIMNTTKTSTSVMFAITPTGRCLPPYVVYKGQRLQDSWINGGPIHVKYNVSKSGWFDADIFIDWFKQIVLPFVRRLPANEPKVVIGDNLPSHMSLEIIELCEQYNIRMVFFPPNATHLLQPLDVGCFAPLKKAWRSVLTEWKMGEGQHLASMPKWSFPRLLLSVMQVMDEKWPQLCASSFRTCGIHPFNPNAVLSKMRPEEHQPENVSEELLAYLKEKRDTSVRHQAPRRKRLAAPPGSSVSLSDLSPSTSGTAPSTAATITGTPTSGTQPKPRKLKRLVSAEDSGEESDDEFMCELLCDDPEPVREDSDPLQIGSYCLVRFAQKKSVVHYVGKIRGKSGSDWEIDYYRKADSDSSGDYGFSLPQNPDEGLVCKEDIECVLKVKDLYKEKVYFKKEQFGGLLLR